MVYNQDNKRPSDQVAAVNQFDQVFDVFTDTPEEGAPLNMTRADFAGTFPTAPTAADMEADEATKTDLETMFDEKTDPTLGNVEGSIVYTDEMPATGASNGLTLIDLRGKDYDDPSWDLLLDELNMSEVANMLANAGYNTAEMLSIVKPATLDYDGPMGWSTWVSAAGGDAVCLGFPAQEVLAPPGARIWPMRWARWWASRACTTASTAWYAPAMNTHRSAFAGRNYEYYSEDGLLSGKMAASEVSGAMEKGVYCYLKHFALNDKEDGRNGMATFANEQAIREIYMKPFELCVKEASATINYTGEDGQMTSREIKAATAIMSAYNCIGTQWSGGNYGMMTQVLRNEWGFEGAVISDYYGGNAYMDPDEGVRAGNDLMLNTFADGSLSDTSSATGVTAMRNARPQCALHGGQQQRHAGHHLRRDHPLRLAGWQKALIAGDVVVAVIVVAGAALLLRKKKTAKA